MSESIADAPRRQSMVAVVAVSCLAGAVVALGVTAATRSTKVIERNVAAVTAPAPPASHRVALAAGPTYMPTETIVRNVGRSVARLDVHRLGGWTSGAGVLVDERGTVITSATLLAGAGETIVTFDDGRPLKATLIGIDVVTGVAALRVAASSRPPAAIADRRARVGEPVALVGRPAVSSNQRASRGTVSTAVIRAVGRVVAEPTGTLHDMFEIDREVLPDTNGGVLTDESGKVLGVAVADSPSDGVGYVVPADVAYDVANGLATSGKVSRSWLGVQAVDLDPPTASSLDLTGGARVTAVTQGGPAAKAGIHTQDVIIAIDQRSIRSASDVVVVLRTIPAGHAAQIRVVRGGKRLALATALGGE